MKICGLNHESQFSNFWIGVWTINPRFQSEPYIFLASLLEMLARARLYSGNQWNFFNSLQRSLICIMKHSTVPSYYLFLSKSGELLNIILAKNEAVVLSSPRGDNILAVNDFSRSLFRNMKSDNFRRFFLFFIFIIE